MKHKLVAVANQYPWCSAAWFERTASPAQVKTIYGFKTDKLQVPDEYEVPLDCIRVSNPSRQGAKATGRVGSCKHHRMSARI